MIKKYSDWQKLDEVDELTEFKLTGKYINNIIQTYEKHPGVRPSRELSNFTNTKGVQPLSTFVKGISGRNLSEIITSVINDWYKWPDQSKSKNVLIQYVNNEDDLSNLSGLGLPFGKVFQADPSLALPSWKAITKTGKGLFRMIPKLFMKESNSRINEGVILGLVASFVLQSMLSAGMRYSLYGKESLEDDMFFSWTTPYLPDVQGLVGDDPIIATYVTTYNTVMMIVYDAWNLCMGQEKYGEQKNPILNWNSGDNYINTFYKQFYESDADIKGNFTSFMENLKNACLSDMKNPAIFQKCPFYYTGDKVRVNFEGKESISIQQGEWYKWLKENYTKYMLVPVSRIEFNATERKGEFMPLSPLGVNEVVKGDPMRSITIQFPNGSITNLSLLELELYLSDPKNIEAFELESQDITKGGGSLSLKKKEGIEEGSPQEKPNLPTTNPPVVQGSTIEQIAANIKSEDLESFVGMGNV